MKRTRYELKRARSQEGSALGIGAVAARAGLSPATLRFYEARGLVARPERVAGRRRYAPSVFDRLAAIRLARSAGFTLAEAKALLVGERGLLVAAKRVAIAQRIDEALRMQALLEGMARCGCISLDDCGRLARRLAGA